VGGGSGECGVERTDGARARKTWQLLLTAAALGAMVGIAALKARK
jgi:hypothetical protein